MTRRFLPSLASLVVACGLWAAAPLMAEDHAPAATHETAPAAHEAPQSTGHAEAAHEPTHEAGHGAATHEAHHGPEVKFMGRVLGPGGQFALKVVNFAIFFFGLFFLLKGALRSAFKARTQEIQDKLSQAERDKAQGEAQLRELDAKMKGLQVELDDIMTKAQRDAEAEKERILASARTEADQILAQTRQEIEAQKRSAERELRALVADLAVQGAKERLEHQVQGDTAATVLDRSITQVGAQVGGAQ